MPALTLRLLGPGALLSGATVVRTHSARTFALLAYLAVEADRRHARAALVDLLWPDLPEPSGRQSLRQALYSLRQVAGGALEACLQVDPQWVQFRTPAAGGAVDIDLHRFLAAVQGRTEADWLAAAAIPLAPLLEGRSAVPGHAHQAWLLATRDRIGALAMQNLGRLVTACMARGDWAGAADLARAMCALDPASEVASCTLLKVLAAQGLPQAIDAEWIRLSTALAQSFGVAPSAESAALLARLRPADTGRPAAPPPPAGSGAVAPSVAGDPADARDAEAMVWAGQAAERVFAFSQAADLYDRALRVMARGGAAPARRVDVLLRRDAVLERLGRRADQLLVIDEAMAIAQQLPDPARVALVSLRRAGVCAYLRRHADAQAAAEQALQIFRDLGDAPGEAEALRELGFLHWHADQHAEALLRTRQALDLHRRIGDATGEATALHNLAEIHRGLGSPAQACQWFEQAIRQHWAAGNAAGEMLSLFGWAQSLRQTGDLPACAAKLQAALALGAQCGDRVMHARVLHALATLQAAEGALDLAIDGMRRAIEVDRAIGYAHALGHDLVDLADLHLRTGDVAQARVAMREALVWFGFNEDAAAVQSTRARLAVLDTHGAAALPAAGVRSGVKSHLALGEGKVYCAFESPLGLASRGLA